MAPLIDTELERIDKKHAVLTQLSSKLVHSLEMYYTLMREPFSVAKQPPPNSPFHQPPPPQVFNGPVSYSLPPEHYMMGPPQPGTQFPHMGHVPRPEDMGPQSMPPQPNPNQQMSFPQSGLPEFMGPFAGGMPPHSHAQHSMPPPTSAFSGPSPNQPPPTNGQHL